MAYEPPIAVLDACVLYPFHLRNLLLQCAVDRLIEARWTDVIHDEWIRNLAENNPDLTRAALLRNRDVMNRVLPSANVTEYEQHIPAIALKDADDRHVVAAGIVAGASLIVTWNVRDFPAKELARHSVRKITPDALMMELYAAMPNVVVATTNQARRNLTKSGLTAITFLEVLERQRLVHFVAAMDFAFERAVAIAMRIVL